MPSSSDGSTEMTAAIVLADILRALVAEGMATRTGVMGAPATPGGRSGAVARATRSRAAQAHSGSRAGAW